MELFRNVGIRKRILLTTLPLVIAPIVVFGYILVAELSVQGSVIVFLAGVFLFITVVASWLVGSSILAPLDRIDKRIRQFLHKRVANPIKDHGQDEPAGLASVINRLFAAWNAELVIQLKREQKQTEQTVEVTSVREDLGKKLEHARACLDIARRLNTTFDFQTNLKTILDAAVRSMNVQWTSILLLNRETMEMSVVCARGIEKTILDDLSIDNYPTIRLKPHEGLAGEVIKAGLPLIANKGHKDPRFKRFSDIPGQDEKIASILCAPIKGEKDQCLGVLNFINRVAPPIFRHEDLLLAEDICKLVTLVIERNRFYRDLFLDEQTGLTAFNVWKGCFEQEAARSMRYTQALSLLIIEVDHFLLLADQTSADFAQQTGIEIGRICQSLLRDSDLGSRVQDRFYFLLPSTDTAGALFLAGRMKDAISRCNVVFEGKTFRLTASAGIANFPEGTAEAKQLMLNAQSALEEAKRVGRDRAVIFRPQNRDVGAACEQNREYDADQQPESEA